MIIDLSHLFVDFNRSNYIFLIQTLPPITQSRSKAEDPEQLKLKQKAKEMQRAELEEARQREANETALLAIGPRKKLKISHNPTNAGGNLSFNSSSNSVPLSLLSFSNSGNKQVSFYVFS